MCTPSFSLSQGKNTCPSCCCEPEVRGLLFRATSTATSSGAPGRHEPAGLCAVQKTPLSSPSREPGQKQWEAWSYPLPHPTVLGQVLCLLSLGSHSPSCRGPRAGADTVGHLEVLGAGPACRWIRALQLRGIQTLLGLLLKSLAQPLPPGSQNVQLCTWDLYAFSGSHAGCVGLFP